MAFDESGFEENVGAISAILIATIAVYTCTAATLILLCQNDGLVFAQQSLWPKTWLTVVEPLVVAWLFLFLLACANPVVQCVEKARRCREALGKVLSATCWNVALVGAGTRSVTRLPSLSLCIGEVGLSQRNPRVSRAPGFEHGVSFEP